MERLLDPSNKVVCLGGTPELGFGIKDLIVDVTYYEDIFANANR